MYREILTQKQSHYFVVKQTSWEEKTPGHANSQYGKTNLNASSYLSQLSIANTLDKDNIVPRPRPAFCRLQYGKAVFIRAWGEPGNDAKIREVTLNCSNQPLS